MVEPPIDIQYPDASVIQTIEISNVACSLLTIMNLMVRLVLRSQTLQRLSIDNYKHLAGTVQIVKLF